MIPINNPLISVIIPIFNGQNHMQRCVDSVITQTYKNIEIVLINDGSTDSTPAICDSFAKMDSRVKVHHKENGGLSDARNVGIDISSGEYITFIDSDDFILPDYVEYLYSLITKFGAEMSICTHTVICRNGRRIVYGDGTELSLSPQQTLKEILYHGRVDLSVWAKLYHRSLFEGVRYPYGKYFEDVGTTYRLIDKCQKIASGGTSKYEYILRSDSMISDKFTTRKLDLLEMTDRMAAYITEKYPSLASAALRRRVYARFSTINQMVHEAGMSEDRREMIKFIRTHQKAVLSDPLTPQRDKWAIHLLRLGYPIYSICWRIYLYFYKNN